MTKKSPNNFLFLTYGNTINKYFNFKIPFIFSFKFLTYLNCEGTIFTQHRLKAKSCNASSAFLNNLQNTRNAQTRTADDDFPS